MTRWLENQDDEQAAATLGFPGARHSASTRPLHNGRMRVSASKTAAGTCGGAATSNVSTTVAMARKPLTLSDNAISVGEQQQRTQRPEQQQRPEQPQHSAHASLLPAHSGSLLWDSSPVGSRALLLPNNCCPETVRVLPGAGEALRRHAHELDNSNASPPVFIGYLIGRAMAQRAAAALPSSPSHAANARLWLTVDRFDPGKPPLHTALGRIPREPTLLLDGDVPLPVYAGCGDEVILAPGDFAELLSSHASIPIALTYRQDNTLMATMKLSKAAITACPILSLRLAPSTLYTQLIRGMVSGPAEDKAFALDHGFIVIDRARNAVLLHREDPVVSQLSLSGIWLSGVASAKDANVYLAAMDFARGQQMRLDHFLMVLFQPGQRMPSFFDCTFERSLINEDLLFRDDAPLDCTRPMDLRPMLAMQDETENICDTALGRTSTKAEADGECEESVVQDAIPTSPFRAAVDASCSPTPPADAADPPNPASNPELYLTFLQQQLDFLRTQFGFQKTPVKESMQLPITTSSPVVVSSPLALRQHVATTVSIGTNTSFIEPRQRVANAVSSSPQITAVAPASASSDNSRTGKIDCGAQTSQAELDSSFGSRELALNMPTQFPSILRPDHGNENANPPGMLFQPAWPQSTTMLNPEDMITDRDEREFIERGVDWDGEGFTSISVRMERRRERELEAANRSMAELDTILRRVTSALSSNPNDQTAMSVGAARDEPRRHSFSTMDVAQQVRRDIPDGPLLAPPVAAMKVARRVEDLRDAEESFILVNDTAAPALAESTQHRQNDIPTAVSTPRLANAEGIPSTKDAVEALPCSSYDPERYDSKDATVDATHLAHSFQSLELMHRYGVLDAETNAVITTPAQADMSTVSSILGDQSMAQADDQTHDDVHITDVVSMSRRQRPPLMPTVTRPATALRKERPLIQRALAPQKLAVDVGDCTYDTTIMSDAADMTVEQYSVASLEYLRRHGLL